jgi:hypothetical protein
MHSPFHSDRFRREEAFAMAVIAWAMVAGVCVMVANAWAMGA